MLILRTHSNLNIRSHEQNVSRLEIPNGLSISIPLSHEFTDISSSVFPGTYEMITSVNGFNKERGELIVDGVFYHIEIISLITADITVRKPIIIRIWDIVTSRGFEYLFSNNTLAFRHFFLNTNISTNTIIMQIADFLADNISGRVSSEATCVIGMEDFPFLVPNFTQEEYVQRINSLAYGPSLSTSINDMINLFYGPLNNDNLLQLIGILDGRLPKRYLDSFQHHGTTNESMSNVAMTFTDIHPYFAIMILARIPFDHFSINIELIPNYRITVDELDSMSGLHLPLTYDQTLLSINNLCAEFLYRYFNITNITPEQIAYHDAIDTDRFIDRVYLKRTMDEFITMTVYSNGYIYERTFDLIMLSTMSPVINA